MFDGTSSLAGSALDAFHRQYWQRYGFSDAERSLEIVNVRLRMVAQGEPYAPTRSAAVPGDGEAACYAKRDVFFNGRFIPSSFYRRDGLTPGDFVCGPAMITEYTAATLLPPGSSARMDEFRNLIINPDVEARA
jgi:N-methylhydantoinase A